MKHKKKLVTGITAAGLAVALGVVSFGPSLVGALWDENRAVHIDPREIETSTLIIGSHLIHISALNDSIYDIAMESAGESGQENIFYKSELANDAWFNITTASTLEDITTGGSPVTDDVIRALFMTHHTKSDQKTYDLRTGKPVNVFDLKDPYDRKTLDELQPLKMQYDLIMGRDGENDVTERIDKIFDTGDKDGKGQSVELDGEILDSAKLDAQMDALEKYLNVLKEHKADPAQINKVNTVMGGIDAGRRLVVFVKLDEQLGVYLKELIGTTSDDEDEQPDPALSSAVSESQKNVQESIIKYQGKMLAKGTTVASEVEFEFSTQLIKDAENNDHASCDVDVANLLHLDHIQNDVISKRADELTMLDEILMDRATDRYTGRISKGETGAYKAEVAKRSSSAVLQGIVTDSAGEANAARGELEFFIDAKCKRMETKEAINFIDERLALTLGDFFDMVKTDAFKEAMDASVQAHVDFLNQKRAELEKALGGNEMDKLAKEKEELQDKRMSALDHNDLKMASELDKKISELDDKMRDLEKENAALLAQTTDPFERNALKNKLGDGSLGKKVAELTKQAKEGNAGTGGGLTTGTSDDAQDAINALEGLVDTKPMSAIPALQEIREKQGEKDELEVLDALMDAAQKDFDDKMNNAKDDAERAALEALTNDGQVDDLKNKALAGIGPVPTGGTDASGDVTDAVNALAALMPVDPGLVGPALQEVFEDLSGKGGDAGLLGILEDALASNPGALVQGMGADELDKLLNQFLRDDLGSNKNTKTVDGVEAVILLEGLQKFYDKTGNQASLDFIDWLSNKLYGLGDHRVFKRINDPSGHYIPATAVASITHRRLVLDKNRSMTVLAHYGDYYGFTLYSTEVLRDKTGEKTEQMARMARNQAGLHIPGEYCTKAFECWPIYLTGTNLGLACNKASGEKADALVELLMSATDEAAKFGEPVETDAE